MNGVANKVVCGDVNTTLIKTEKGRSILLQFDVHTGRPYNRLNKLCGTVQYTTDILQGYLSTTLNQADGMLGKMKRGTMNI